MAEFTDKELESSIAQMLRAGVLLAAAIVVAGGLLYLRHPSRTMPDYAHFHASPASLRTISGIVRGTLQLDAASIIQLGLLVLIATPVARVAMCIVGFARQRDKIYVGISIGVFAILMYSLIHGGR